MGMFDGCLLASDIDGTLLDNGYINPRCIEKIKYFVSEGGNFSLSTGRSVGAVSDAVNAIDCLSPSVVSNGAMIYDYKNKKILKEYTLSSEDKCVAELVYNTGLDIGIEIHSGERALVVKRNCETDAHEEYESLEVEFIDLDEAKRFEWTKILFAVADLKDFEPTMKMLKDVCKTSDVLNTIASIEERQRYYIEVVPKGVSKAKSIKTLCELLNINDGCCYAIGDYYNDVPMLEGADICAVPVNSPADIKALADVIVSTAKDGAVADFIDYLIGRKTENGCDK